MGSSPSSGSVNWGGFGVPGGGFRAGGGLAASSLSADGPKDTSVEDVLEKTFLPSLKTFEEEVMDAAGIVETRRARKSYWY